MSTFIWAYHICFIPLRGQLGQSAFIHIRVREVLSTPTLAAVRRIIFLIKYGE